MGKKNNKRKNRNNTLSKKYKHEGGIKGVYTESQNLIIQSLCDKLGKRKAMILITLVLVFFTSAIPIKAPELLAYLGFTNNENSHIVCTAKGHFEGDVKYLEACKDFIENLQI